MIYLVPGLNYLQNKLFSIMKLKKNYLPVDLFLIVFLTAYIALFCWVGLYVRLMPGDDYGFADGMMRYGFWPYQVMSYNSWTGRIFNTFLVSLATSWPKGESRAFLPSITIFIYSMSIWFMVGTVRPSTSLRTKFLLTLTGTAVTLSFLLSLNETLYWVAGMPYFWTTSLLILIFSLAIKSLRSRKFNLSFILCIILIFLNGTLLEQPCVFQGAIAFFTLIFYIFQRDLKRTLIASIFFLAAFLAFLVMLLAPGNAIRMAGRSAATLPFFQRIIRTLAIAFAYGLFTAIKFFIKPLVYAFLLFLPLIAKNISAFNKKISVHVRVWHIVLITALVGPFMQIIMGWALGVALPQRAESLTLWMMGAIWCLLWTFFYHGPLVNSSSKIFEWRWTILILCLLINSNFFDLLKDIKLAPDYKAESDARVNYILEQRAKGIKDISVVSLKTRPAFLYIDLDIFPPNEAFARYYGVNSIMALPDSLSNDIEAEEEIKRGSAAPLIRAAEKGDADLQFKVGVLYDPAYGEEHGIKNDIQEAARWYLKSAENGNPWAKRSLARITYTIDSSIRGCLKALSWLAASQVSMLRL